MFIYGLSKRLVSLLGNVVSVLPYRVTKHVSLPSFTALPRSESCRLSSGPNASASELSDLLGQELRCSIRLYRLSYVGLIDLIVITPEPIVPGLMRPMARKYWSIYPLMV